MMYGMMPSAKTDSCSSAPPENRFSSVNTPLASDEFSVSMHFWTLPKETPGLGSVAPNR